MDHDDYGGLLEDLRLTGAAMKRRNMTCRTAAHPPPA